MKLKNIFPVTIIEDYLEVPSSLIDTIRSVSGNKKCVPPNDWDAEHKTSFNYNDEFVIYEHPSVEEIINRFRFLCRENSVFDEYGNDYRYSIEAWWNHYSPGQGQEYHCHGNQYISCIWHLTDDDSHSVFADRGKIHKEKTEAGKLVFFPSWLSHYVEPAKSERITVALNFGCMRNYGSI